MSSFHSDLQSGSVGLAHVQLAQPADRRYLVRCVALHEQLAALGPVLAALPLLPVYAVRAGDESRAAPRVPDPAAVGRNRRDGPRSARTDPSSLFNLLLISFQRADTFRDASWLES